jgi:hypothetical protein
VQCVGDDTTPARGSIAALHDPHMETVKESVSGCQAECGSERVGLWYVQAALPDSIGTIARPRRHRDRHPLAPR